MNYKNLLTWNDVLAKNNETQEQFDKRTEHDTDPQKGDKQVESLTKAINRPDWKPDYSNPNQRKWFPVFVWSEKKAGFVFCCATYACTTSHAGLGPRLCFETEEQAIHAGTEFIEIYNRALQHVN
jgi:hypothetical protein